MSTSIRELPLEEKIRLVEDLWDSIAEDEAAVPVPDAHKVELDIRLRAFELDRNHGEEASAVIDRIRRVL